MNRFCLEVSGDFACFTRPEMKVERVFLRRDYAIGGALGVRGHFVEAGDSLGGAPHRGLEADPLDQRAA